MSTPKDISRNLNLLKWVFTFAQTPMYFFALIYFYQLTDSYFIAGNLTMIAIITQSIMEIPTGILSDKYLGRKGSYIAGMSLYALAFSFYALGSINYLFIIPGRIFFGTAKAFGSGNTNSLLYDSLRDEKKSREFHKFLSKFNMYRYLYWSFSILVAGIVSYYFDIIYVVYYCIIQRIFNVILGLFISEPKSHREDKKDYTLNAMQHLGESFKIIFKNKHLFLMSVIYIFRRSIFFGLDRFHHVFYKKFISFASLGILMSVSLFINAIVSKNSEKIAKRFGNFKTLLGIEYTAIPLQFIAYIIPGIHSLFLIETSMQTHPISEITSHAIFHEEFSNKQRATLESLIAIFGAIFLGVFTSLIGFLADTWTLSYALLFGICCRIVLIPLLHYTFRENLVK